MAKLSGPYTIPDERVALIGRVADVWANLEFHIDCGIWALSGTHQQLAACITSQFTSVHPRLRAFATLTEVRGATPISIGKITSFIGALSGLVERRNRAVHDPRFKQKSTGEIVRLEITARPRDVQFGFLPEDKSELETVIAQISEKVREFMALRDSVIAEIEALPPERRPPLKKIIPVNEVPPIPPSGAAEPA